MKIALAEYEIAWENRDDNLKTAQKICETASQSGVDLLCFPEMSFTGFSMNTGKTKQDKFDDFNLVKDCDMAVGIGWVKDCGDLCENHYSVCNASGIILDCTKIHPFSYAGENLYFRGGNELKVCDFCGFSVGAAICYDLRFGDTFSALADMCHLVLVPANWPASRSNHWKTLLSARAVENQCYVAGINCMGNIGGIRYSGDSAIYNPDGVAIKPSAVIKDGRSRILIYEIENDVCQYRDNFPVRQDRRCLTARR
ncbi:MAG: nitrilase-related carbon-nitrogen hydrolase [Lachnospiraceae bacterium]